MLAADFFFFIILISILGPTVGLVVLIFYSMMEQKVHLLETENKRIFIENELQRSEYLQLTQQIQPHFFFNTLNSLLSLARLKKIDKLIEALEHLALFLRYKYQEKEHLNPLQQEIDYTRHYLAIQEMRYGDRLKIIWDVDPGLSNALAPQYVLQTLVENAFKHGFQYIEGDFRLEICLSRKVVNKRDMLEMAVFDNGVGFTRQQQEENSFGDGIGLTNIEKRLHLLFGSQARIEITAGIGTGGGVRVNWPLDWGDEV
ncbi:MAG: histidine kinase [Bacillota bacterium]|nr:histidine kinase [Bacillota bacterium]